jgi:hypothetical protein
MQVTYFGTCINMHFSLNRRGSVFFTYLIAGLQICLAVPGWTEEVNFGCEYDEETIHGTSTSNSVPKKQSYHGETRYAIDWQGKRVHRFGRDKEYELKFSDAEVRIQRKTQNSLGERFNKGSESIIINRYTGEYILSEKTEGQYANGMYWYTYKTRKGTCKKIDEPPF